MFTTFSKNFNHILTFSDDFTCYFSNKYNLTLSQQIYLKHVLSMSLIACKSYSLRTNSLKPNRLFTPFDYDAFLKILQDNTLMDAFSWFCLNSDSSFDFKLVPVSFSDIIGLSHLDSIADFFDNHGKYHPPKLVSTHRRGFLLRALRFVLRAIDPRSFFTSTINLVYIIKNLSFLFQNCNSVIFVSFKNIVPRWGIGFQFLLRFLSFFNTISYKSLKSTSVYSASALSSATYPQASLRPSLEAELFHFFKHHSCDSFLADDLTDSSLLNIARLISFVIPKSALDFYDCVSSSYFSFFSTIIPCDHRPLVHLSPGLGSSEQSFFLGLYVRIKNGTNISFQHGAIFGYHSINLLVFFLNIYGSDFFVTSSPGCSSIYPLYKGSFLTFKSIQYSLIPYNLSAPRLRRLFRTLDSRDSICICLGEHYAFPSLPNGGDFHFSPTSYFSRLRDLIVLLNSFGFHVSLKPYSDSFCTKYIHSFQLLKTTCDYELLSSNNYPMSNNLHNYSAIVCDMTSSLFFESVFSTIPVYVLNTLEVFPEYIPCQHFARLVHSRVVTSDPLSLANTLKFELTSPIQSFYLQSIRSDFVRYHTSLVN